jgi:hypothetical protein
MKSVDAHDRMEVAQPLLDGRGGLDALDGRLREREA